MRRALALVLALGLLPITTSANHMSNKHWRSDAHVVVADYTGPGLDGYVEIITRNWQAAIGTGALTLTYERRAERSCDDVGTDWKAVNNVISVCQMAGTDENPAGDTELKTRDNRIQAAWVRLVARDWTKPGPEAGYWWHPLGCHEMGHALGLDHFYTDFSEHHTCMGTQGQSPGDHDVEALKNQYGGKRGVSVFQSCCERVRLVRP